MKLCMLILGLCVTTLTAQAALQVEIVGAPSHEMPIVLGPLASTGGVPSAVDDAIQKNLSVSGVFRVLPSPDAQACTPLPAQAEVWRSAAVTAFFSGQWTSGQLSTCLWDIPSSRLLSTEHWSVPEKLMKTEASILADEISDHIYQKLTGHGPYFLSRILYIMQRSQYDYAIQSTNVTGTQVHSIYASQYPILSPSWDDSGKVLLFVSFYSGKPVLQMIDFEHRTKEMVANFKGTNSSGVFSHDGTCIAMVLTKDGHAQIYEMNRKSKELQRVMVSESMDTEPVYSPDNQYLYFTSNREGSAQIYRVQRRTHQVERMTYQYSAAYSPAISHNNQWLAYVAKKEAGFVIVVQNLSSGESHVISAGPNDLHPSFSPNDELIAFSAEDAHYQRMLSIVSRDGHFHYTVSLPDRKIRQPFWGPLAKT